VIHVLSLPSIARFTIFNHSVYIRTENFKFSSVLNSYCPFNKIWGGRMKNRKLLVGLLGMLVATGLLSGTVKAASIAPVPRPTGVHYKQISQCEWYGEDIETDGISLLGGIGASASAYFYVCYPPYWYDDTHYGWAYGLGDLWGYYRQNSVYSVGTVAYGDVMGAYFRVIASVGIPPNSA